MRPAWLFYALFGGRGDETGGAWRDAWTIFRCVEARFRISRMGMELISARMIDLTYSVWPSRRVARMEGVVRPFA